ncbi:hypothetical protein COY16_03340 [Candidatus Roizmanbacteria bacterium CG_4_10_14_0_2_um_filter_39_13]|uniref:RDD domain-containing protein n=1 Tax=Candidatus Roizmanbacteria bacterium CG_4_10_14_0_2_um_filter_39_13 TaxID=1974825 RepID=A0A2M7TYB0_9BACT|nr:MAG: hypothetical protein COY16_03340 [Candidatus Roizmanbacteria bacterium CG_4_10_14_0_2_um_filter_39_13]
MEKIDSEYKYASLTKRAAAYFFDYFLILGINIVIVFIIGLLYFLFRFKMPTFPIVGYLTFYLLYVIYHTFFLTRWSTTPGKKAFGMMVVTEVGSSVSVKHAFTRSLLQPFSLLLFGIGYINVEKDVYKQAWHDKKAHTIVVSRQKRHYIWQTIIAIIGLIIYLGIMLNSLL